MAKTTSTAETPHMTESVPVAEVPAQDFVYVTIPDRDLFEFPYSGIDINQTHYGPGTHKVSQEVAKDLNDRLKRWREEDIRVLSPKRHLRSLLELETNKQPGVQQVDPTKPIS